MKKIDSSLILKVLSLPKIGAKTASSIMNYLIGENLNILNDKELYELVCDFTKNTPFANLDQLKEWINSNEIIVKESEERNIKMINIFDDDYPQNLKSTNNPPLLLHYLGNLSSLNENPCLAMIGTRKPSNYGFQAGKKLASILAEQDINIVSGLALGSDTAGHLGAIEVKKLTTAVLGHGLQMIYPKKNAELADNILKNNGLLITEYPYGKAIHKASFVERDRIQAGLSLATIVIETGITGGTMHTVKYTCDYKRKLYCLKHPEKHLVGESVQGNLQLLKNRTAIAIEGKDSVNQLITDFSVNKKIQAPEQLSLCEE